MRTDQKGRDTMKKHRCTSICITVVAVLLLACGTALAAWNVSEYAILPMIGAKIEMKNVKPNIRKIFDMTGVLKIIPIVEEEHKNEKTV